MSTITGVRDRTRDQQRGKNLPKKGKWKLVRDGQAWGTGTGG